MSSNPDTGYLYVPNWERFQHYKDRAPAWIKLHLSLEGNDAWLDLNPSDRCLLLSIWMVVARYGNGRVRRDDGWLRARAKTPKGSVDRLIQAGLVEVRASTVPPPDRSPEVEKEVEEETPYPLSDSTKNGAHTKRHKPGVIAACRRLYNDAIAEGEPTDHIREVLEREYRHDTSIVHEAVPHLYQETA